MKRQDLTGKTFHLLTVLEYAFTKNSATYWKCLCVCGNITYVRSNNLKSGAVKSCGCLLHAANNATHHMSKTKLFRVWWAMKNRCNNPSEKSYKDYGGRGIKVCYEWDNSSIAFFEWAINNGYKEGLTIERINVNGDYCPENCKWIPKLEQAKNRRSSYSITYQNKTQNLTDWCNELGVPYKLAHNRIFKLGWDIERVFTEACHTEKRNITRKGDCNG